MSTVSAYSIQSLTLLETLRNLVLDEKEAADAHLREIWRRPLNERVEKGWCLPLSHIQPGPLPYQLVLHFKENLSRFREGDLVCLNPGDPFEQPCWHELLIEEENSSSLLVSHKQAPDILAFCQNHQQLWTLDTDTMDLTAYYLNAIDDLGKTCIGRERVLPLLLGQADNAMDADDYQFAHEYALQSECNDDQADAIASGYATALDFCTQGPPGTGKTRTLAHLVSLLVEKGERVLVTAHTHMAINNALNKIHELAPELPIVKVSVASGTKALNPAIDRVDRFNLWEQASTTSHYVVGATPFACRSSRLANLTFDTVIFDEASQATIPLALMAMLSGKRYLFFGDHQQLPPVLQSRSRLHDREASVFEQLIHNRESVMLTETWRMNEPLTRWPSTLFYDNRLIASPLSRTRQLSLHCNDSPLANILNPDAPMVWLDQPLGTAQSVNATEAEQIAYLCRALIKAGVSPDEIGVVAPFRSQGRQIRNVLNKLLGIHAESIVTDTVERMQGQERDVILLSLTSTDICFVRAIAEFWYQPERLNVSVTRARSKLIILGCAELLDWTPYNPLLARWISGFRALHAACLKKDWPTHDIDVNRMSHGTLHS